MAGQPGSKAERAFALYTEMTAAERSEYALLCRGYDAAKETKKQPKASPARARAVGVGKEVGESG